MLRLVLYPEADAAIADILAYTMQHYGKAQAEAYAGALKKALQHLSEFPGTGKAHPAIPQEVRFFPVEKHMVIYRVMRDELHVITVLHQAINVAERLRKLTRLLV